MKKIIAGLFFSFAVLTSVAAAQDEPEIMSYKDYGAIRHERPYILRFAPEKGALLYFGIGHVYDPGDKQIAMLEKEFLAFRPTLLLNESGTPPVAETAAAAIEKYGEPGLMSFLAKKHDIPIKSLDPPQIEEIKYILSTRRWTLEQVFLFYVLRRIPQNAKKITPQTADAMIQEAMDRSAKLPGFEGLPKTIKEFDALAKKHFPDVKDWRAIEQKVFDPNPDLDWFTNSIADASVEYRGRFMIKTLAAEVAKGERVFAVVGASHVVKQEKALKKIFPR